MSEPTGSSKPAPLGLGDAHASPSPADYADLVRDLRAWAPVPEGYPVWYRAADAIEALVARVAELTRLVELLSPEGQTRIVEPLYARIAALEAEARQHALDLHAAEARASGAEAKLAAYQAEQRIARKEPPRTLGERLKGSSE